MGDLLKRQTFAATRRAGGLPGRLGIRVWWGSLTVGYLRQHRQHRLRGQGAWFIRAEA